MSEALTYLYYIFNKFNTFVFNDAVMFTGVTVGWVVVSIILFSMIIGSLLNIPRGVGKFNFDTHVWNGSHEYTRRSRKQL